MNGRMAFWILLVAANAGMWFFFVRQQSLAKAQPGKIVVVTNRIVAPAGAGVTVIRTNGFNWAQLESEDYRMYITRLRSIGCPEQTIRDIVIADLEKMMA